MEFLEHIQLSKANNVVDWNGIYYKKEVLTCLKVGYEVRIHMFVNDESPLDGWDLLSDSPYLKVVELHDDRSMVGEVTSRYRQDDDSKYPVRTGERIWFFPENIIEIPRKYQAREEQIILSQYLDLDEHVPITGPLYLVHYDSNSDSDYSESDIESASDVETRGRTRR
jgi:hypothetical protein